MLHIMKLNDDAFERLKKGIKKENIESMMKKEDKFELEIHSNFIRFLIWKKSY